MTEANFGANYVEESLSVSQWRDGLGVKLPGRLEGENSVL